MVAVKIPRVSQAGRQTGRRQAIRWLWWMVFGVETGGMCGEEDESGEDLIKSSVFCGVPTFKYATLKHATLKHGHLNTGQINTRTPKHRSDKHTDT